MSTRTRGHRVWEAIILAALAFTLGSATWGYLQLGPFARPAAAGSRPVGTGSGSLRLAPGLVAAQRSAPAVPLDRLGPAAGAQNTVLLSEGFESLNWPSGTAWRAFDNNGAEGGQFYWANRCSGHHTARSAWAFGGGANGSLLGCTSNYPPYADSWMIYGPVDLRGATDASLDFMFWLDSECVGSGCATASDRLWALASTDGVDFNGDWWAGDWIDDPSAHPEGWVEGSLDISDFAGEPQLFIAFAFRSDGSVSYPTGALVDDVVLRVQLGCAQTASIRALTTDRSCYTPDSQIGVMVDVGTTLGSQDVMIEARLWSGDVVWASASRAATAPGQQVVPLSVPQDLFPDEYEVVVRVFDQDDPLCLQDTDQRTIRVDPVCGTVTAPVPTTVTPTHSPTPTPTIRATLCPNETVHETKRITIPAAPGRADIVFVFDTTNSMGPVLTSAKTNALAIMSSLAGLIPDVQFGVVDLRDYPTNPFGDPGDWPYLVRQPVTADRSAVVAAVGATGAGGGNDYPEAYSRALFEATADPGIGWRADTRRFVVMFGDDVPHDNNLNERVVAAPVNPGGVWCGDTPAGCVRDLGRDGFPGTADDIDFQSVLDSLNGHRITLLFVVSGGGSTSQDNLVTYWKQWAGWTNTGGDAVRLNDAAGLPAAIQSLVTAASRRIGRLELRAVPPEYQAWLTVVPPAYTDLTIPAGGTMVTFEVDIRVPPGTAAGTVHTFAVRAIGDGAVYGGQGVTITVPHVCATPTPTPSATAPTPTPTPVVCPPTRPTVTPECPAPDYVRNADFERRGRSWGQYSRSGRVIISPVDAVAGFYSAHFRGSLGQVGDEILYQYLDVPPDATAATFRVDNMQRYLIAAGAPPSGSGNFFRASLYDLSLTSELVRMWEFDPLLPIECPVDPPGYNLSEAQLALVRGRTIALVLRLNKVALGWETGVVLDGIHMAFCSPSPPCRVAGNKVAAPVEVPPNGESTVTLSLTGLGGACLPERRPSDVMLVIDSSGSMEGQPLADAKAAAKGFLDRLDPSLDQVGLVSFADTAAVQRVLGPDVGPVRTAIDALDSGTGTNIADGLDRAAAELAGPRHRPSSLGVIVLLSDGRPTAGGDPRVPASAAKVAGARLLTIGLGNEVDPELLRDLASSPSEYFYAPDSGRLEAIYQQIAGLLNGSPATNVVVVDRLSPYVTLVPDSFTGSPAPEVSGDARTLTWRVPRLGLETRIWTYRVKLTSSSGTWPVNESAAATYTDSRGQPAGLAFPNPTVTVRGAGTTSPQLMCRDTETDDGRTPSVLAGEAWWASPDIWVRHSADGVTEHQNPIAGRTNIVYVRVRNTGDGEVRDATVRVYDALGAANLRWPDDWAPEIGRAVVNRLAAGDSTLVAIPWVPAYSGHYCFLVRMDAPDDPITFDGWVPYDNNLCQRNVQILEPNATGSSTTGVGVGNRERGHGYGGIRVSSADFPTGGTGRVVFSDTEVFDRWQRAGGSASGGRVDPATHSVLFDILPPVAEELSNGSVPGASSFGQASSPAGRVSLILDRVSFEDEEMTELRFELQVPPGEPQPVIAIEQIVEGRTVGGNVLRPAPAPRLFLPALLRKSDLLVERRIVTVAPVAQRQ